MLMGTSLCYLNSRKNQSSPLPKETTIVCPSAALLFVSLVILSLAAARRRSAGVCASVCALVGNTSPLTRKFFIPKIARHSYHIQRTGRRLRELRALVS